jgi:hypothetical protein
MVKKIDLFECPKLIPVKVNKVLNKYWQKYGEDMTYSHTASMHKEIERLGYTFDSGLDNCLFGLRPIGVKLTDLSGYENL